MRRTLENTQITRSVADLIAMIEPITAALQVVQADECTLGEAVQVWVNLVEKLGQSGVTIKKMCADRARPLLSDGMALAANVLDHRSSPLS